MSTKQNNNTNTFGKQRFKAVENFLKRIAFNLGNSPSQTDVKIISCIPIDVTDLQQKILKLQNELEITKKNIERDVPPNPSHVEPTVNILLEERRNNGRIKNHSNISISYSYENQNARRHISSSVRSLSQEYPFYSEHSIEVNMDKRGEKNQCLKNFFNKKKHKNKANYCKGNAQVVYYAQTHERSPFNAYSDDFTSKHGLNDVSLNLNDLPDNLSRSFLADTFEKQYRPEPIIKVFSNSSNFSSPVCRDITTRTSYKCNDSEICSCCRGPYNNVNLSKKESITAPDPNNRAKYYDSQHYDIYPVREKAAKIKNRHQSPRIKKSKRRVITLPHEMRPKIVSPVLVNYPSHPPMPTYAKSYPKNPLVKVRSRKQMVLKEMAAGRSTCRPPPPARVARSSKLCCVDYGPVYTKQMGKQPTEIVMPNNRNIILKNKVPSPKTTSNVNDSQKNNPPSKENVKATIDPIDKTETTLNQIKSILQSVLLEVKSNAKEGKTVTPPTKDAVVQNGMSQNNMHGDSHLLQSFTYSPYNMNPYSATCSRQMYSNNFTAYAGLPGAPIKCMQHYPIFIQPQRHVCQSCYRNSNIMKPDTKRAASASTNTEGAFSRSSETHKLIQEIYKSLALNLEIPQKNTPVNDNKSSYIRNSAVTKRLSNIDSKQTTNRGVSEIYRNATELDSSMTRDTDTTIASKAFKEASVGSDFAMRERVKPTRDQSDDSDTSDDNELVAENIEVVEDDEQSDVTVTAVNQHVRRSSSEEDIEGEPVMTLGPPVTIETKKKKGLFNKMLQMLKPKVNKKIDASLKAESESESDSDDYQTVYSHGESPLKPAKHGLSIRSRPKIVYRKYQKRSSPEKGRRQPHVERYHRRHSIEKPSSHEHDQCSCYHGINRGGKGAPFFAQNFEARAALVQQPMMPQNLAATRQGYVDDGAHRQHMHQMQNMSNYTRRPNYFENHPHQGICINYPGMNHNRGVPVRLNPTPSHDTPMVYKGTHKVASSKGLSWLKKHGKKIGIPCGEQWKKFLMES